MIYCYITKYETEYLSEVNQVKTSLDNMMLRVYFVVILVSLYVSMFVTSYVILLLSVGSYYKCGKYAKHIPTVCYCGERSNTIRGE